MYNDLIDIITIDIPESRQREDGFLDIISQGHKENTISSIYAYFLDRDKSRDIARVFLASLLELVYEKSGKHLELNEYKCYIERTTKKGNRIDIVIDAESDKKAVIIENKIYHSLKNDLIDYWDYRDYKADNKVGVILTLFPKHLPPEAAGRFVNISHYEWVGKVNATGLPTEISTHQFVYLTDFIKNIEQLSQRHSMNEQVKFFFRHAGKVLKIIDVYQEAERYVNNQLKIVAEKLDKGRTLGRGGDGYKTIWDDKSHVYYTIITADLLSSKKSLMIIIELYKDAIHKEEELKAILADNGKYLQMNTMGKKTPYWIHFASKTYALSDSDIENMADFVYNVIQEDFEPVMIPIMNYLNTKK